MIDLSVQVVTAEGIKVVRAPPPPDLGAAGASAEAAAVPAQG